MPVCLHCLGSSAHRRNVELAQQVVNDKRVELEVAQQAFLDAEMAMYAFDQKYMELVQQFQYPDDEKINLWYGVDGYASEE